MKPAAFRIGRTVLHGITAARLEHCTRELTRLARLTGFDVAFMRDVARRKAAKGAR